MAIFQPLDQFKVEFLFFFQNIIITNSFIFTLYLYYIVKIFFDLVLTNSNEKDYNVNFFGKNGLKLKENKFRILNKNYMYIFFQELYLFVLGLVKQQISKKGYKYFPIIFTLFVFILLANLLGMFLYSFTLTSHVTIAFTLSFSFFIGVLVLGIYLHKWKFVETFIPKGAPKYLLQALIVIEIISYFSKPFSLGIRLFANMMSGHTLLIILASFALVILEKSFYIFLIPFILILVIIGLEIVIAILQTYVFTVLVCIYINDSIVGSH